MSRRRVPPWHLPDMAVLGVVLWFCFSLGYSPVSAQQATTPTVQPSVSSTPEAGFISATPTPTYIVQAGDTLSSLAQRFGTTVDDLAAANGIADPSQLQVGQQLVLPGARPPEWKVQAAFGDSLESLAARYEVSGTQLARRNELVNPLLLAAGQTVIIPQTGSARADATPGGQVYRVRAGDLPVRLAARSDLPLWAILRMNRLSLPALVPGQIVHFPARPRDEADLSLLPRPFMAVRLRPFPPVQGDTLRLVITTTTPVSLTGNFAGQILHFLPVTGTSSWALAAVDAFTGPGPVSLILTATRSSAVVAVRQPIWVQAGQFDTQMLALTPKLDALADPQVRLPEETFVYSATSAFTPTRLWNGRFLPPLAGNPPITTGYGERRSYNGRPIITFHAGVDLSAPAGTPVRAPAAGRVVLAQPLKVRGNAVILDHGAGVFTVYGHLSTISVTVGSRIQPGEILGLVGSTGLSTGPHLHWELRINGMTADILEWLREDFP